MRLATANTHHECKNEHDIWRRDPYYPQRRGKCLCFECGRKKPQYGFLTKLLNRIKR